MIRLAWLVLPLALACGASDSPTKTPAQRYCDAVAQQAESCGTGSPCDAALVTDCVQVSGLLNDGILGAAADCVVAGGSPLGCVVDSREAIVRSPAHDAFASAFCDGCGFGVGGCEETLFGTEDSDVAIAGTVILPLGDALVGELQAQCTDGFTCLAQFPSCAQKVLAEQVPTETVECLLDGLIHGVPPSEIECAPATSGSSGAIDPSAGSSPDDDDADADDAGSNATNEDSSSDPGDDDGESTSSDPIDTSGDMDPDGGDPFYPRADGETCPAGTYGPVSSAGNGSVGFCAPACSEGLCHEGATGDAVPMCAFNPDSSLDPCTATQPCTVDDEACNDAFSFCQLAPSHCVLICNGGQACPDGMTCFGGGACEYPA